MGKYWLLNRHGEDGPSVLVETDGSMRVVDVLRFGPTVDELEAQQQILDEVMGRVAPTLKPMVPATKVAEPGIALHGELQFAGGAGNRNGRRSGGSQAGAKGRMAGGAKRTGGRGRG
jgi:hypothetical protein